MNTNGAGHDDKARQSFDAAEEIHDPLEGLVEKAKLDAGADFVPEVLECLVTLKKEDRARFEKLRAEISRAGCRVTELDKAMAAQCGATIASGSGRPLAIARTEPWTEAVEGAALLTELTQTIERFVIVDLVAARAIALWVVFTHAFSAASVAPKLFITSPQPRSGKTRLIEVLGYMVARPQLTSNLTAAALFRIIEDYCPTLLIDEADSFMKDDEKLRGVINSGFSKESAQVLISVPVQTRDGWEVRKFSTWCPQVIAGIGNLSDTIMDRSFTIRMKRKLRSEKVARLRRRDAGPLIELGRKAARWAADNLNKIEVAAPELPAGLNDRAADGWETCVAIADTAGGDWPKLAREAALALSGDGAVEDGNIRTMLLADIQTAFKEGGVSFGKDDADGYGPRMASEAVVVHLVGLDDRPWPEFRRGKPISKVQLSRLLKPLGISSGSIRLDDKRTAKGYYLTAFADAFARYLPPSPSSGTISNATASQPSGFCGFKSDFETARGSGCAVSKNPPTPWVSASCDGVTDQDPLASEEEATWTA